MNTSENSNSLPQREDRQLLTMIDTSKLSEQKHCKVESGESLLHFQTAFDFSNDVLWDLNMLTHQLYLSPNASKMFNISHPTVLDPEKIWNTVIHEKDRSRLINEFNPIINGQTDQFNVESRIKLDSDVIQWISVKGKVVSRATDGRVNRLSGTFTDNTSIKLKNEELKKKHKQFKSYFENSPVGLAIITLHNTWIELNHELCRMLGYHKEELLQKSWTEVLHSDDIQTTLNLVKETIEGKTDSFKINSRLLKKNGEILYATISCVCARNDNYSLITVINNTEHYKIEEAIKYERIILKTLIDSLPISIYIIDKEGRKLVSNNYDLEIIGYKNTAEVVGKTDRELFPGEVGERGHNDNMYVINNKVAIRNRLENFYDKNGNQRWLLTNKIPLLDQNNQASGLIGFGIDITDLRNLQQRTKDSEAYYRTLVDISPDGILVTDSEGKITFSSKTTLTMLGITDKDDLIGESIFTWVKAESMDSAIRNFTDVYHGVRSPQTSEYICFKNDRSTFWMEVSSSPLLDDSGNSIGLMLLCRDITTRKKIEEDLISAKNKAEESDNLKTAMLRNISHEIRTPLNAILGFSTLLRESSLNKTEVQSYTEIIQQSSNQLLSIINDLIDISSIEANAIKKQDSTLNLNEFLREIQNQFRAEADSKNILLKLTEGLSNDLANIYTDKTKLRQILCNLLGNALKFTHVGQINFGYSHYDSFLEFYVSDTGIGIELKNYSKIFEPFFQTENELTKSYEGTGLGLSICKAYVKLLGGEIWLTSIVNEGSTFFFTIPYENGETHSFNI